MTDFLFDPEHIGVFSPPISTTNQQLVDRLGFEKEFLTDKLGFTGCRHVSADNPVTFLAKAAVADLKLKDTELDTSKIECLVFVTQNPDQNLPATANILQAELGLPKSALCFDINQGCSGFVIGLNVINSIMSLNKMENGLLITADAYSKVLRRDDRNSFPLFSDGAAAVRVKRFAKQKILSWEWGSDGEGANHLTTKLSAHADNCISRDHAQLLTINGREIYNFAILNVPESIDCCLKKASTSKDEVDYFAIHQANKFIVNAIRKKIGVSEERCPFLLSDCGNTIASTIPMFLNLANENVSLVGKKILISGFGVGLSWATALIEF